MAHVKELEAEDIELKDYFFTPKEITVNGKIVIDFTGVENDKVFLCNKKDILDKTRPSWIPEMDSKGLALDKFLPVCVKDFSDGNYFVLSKIYTGKKDSKELPIYKNQIYKMSPDVLAATVDYYLKLKRAELKKEGSSEKVSLPRGMNSMPTSRYNEISSLCLLCEIPSLKYKDTDKSITDKAFELKGKSPSKLYHIQNNIVFLEQWQPLLENIKGKRLDMNYQKQDYIDSYSKAVETAYGDSNTFNNFYNDFGVKIKKQNGSNFSKAEIDKLSETIKKVYNHYGNLSNLAGEYKLKISYADNCMQFARKAIGLFASYQNAIGISFFNEEKQLIVGRNHLPDVTLAHEIAHWLDNQKGKNSHNFFASDKYGTLENQIAEKFKEEIKLREKTNKSTAHIGKTDEIHLGEYWFRTCECFARAMEQYYALKHGIDLSEEISYARKDNFEADFIPLIEKLIEENKRYFNLENNEIIKNVIQIEDYNTGFDNSGQIDIYNVNTKTLYDETIKKLYSEGYKLFAVGYTKPPYFENLKELICPHSKKEKPSFIIRPYIQDGKKLFYIADKDTYKDKDITFNYLNDSLELEIKNEDSGLSAKSYYNSKGTRELCHILKEADKESEVFKNAIEQMADYFVNQCIFNEKSILVPAPQHTGKPEYTWSLAAAISRKTKASIADILYCKPHETLYEQKKNGKEPVIEFYLQNAKGENDLKNLFDETSMTWWKNNGNKVYLIDNVISTGYTFNKISKLLPGIIPAPYAISDFAEINYVKENDIYVVNNLQESNEKKINEYTIELNGDKNMSKNTEQKYIAKLMSNDSTVPIDFWRWGKNNIKELKEGLLENFADGLSLYKDDLSNFDKFVIIKTKPDGTDLSTEVEMTAGDFLLDVADKYKEKHEHFPYEDEFDAPRWKEITDAQKVRFEKAQKLFEKEKNKRIFTVNYCFFSAVERAEFLAGLEHYVNGEKKEKDEYKISDTLNKENLIPIRFIYEGNGFLGESIYESFICKKKDDSGFKYLMVPHNAEYYKGFDKLVLSEKTFSDIEECQNALIKTLVNHKENHSYKIETKTIPFWNISDKYKQPLLSYIEKNEKEICDKTEAFLKSHPEIEPYEELKDNIALYFTRVPDAVDWNSPEWLKICEKIEFSISNPLLADTIEINKEEENKLMEKTDVMKEMTEAEKDSKILLETYGSKKSVENACKKASVSDFTSKDQSRYFMTGIYYEKGFAIATNGKILIKLKKDYPAEWEGKIIDPNTLKVIDGKFPAYEKVFPDKERLVDRSSRLAHISNYLSEATAAIAISENSKHESFVPVMFENTFVNPRSLQLALAFARDRGFNKVFQEDNYSINYEPVLDEKGYEVYKFYKLGEKSEDNLVYKYYTLDELPEDVKNIAAEKLKIVGERNPTNIILENGDFWSYDIVKENKIVYETNLDKPLTRTIEFDAPDGSAILIMPFIEPQGPYIDKDGILKNYEDVTFIKAKLLGKDDELCKNIVRTLIKDSEFADIDVDSIYKKNFEEALSKQNPDVFPKNKKDCQVLATVTTYTDVIGENLDKKDFIFEQGQTTATLQQFVCNLWLERFKDYIAHPEHVFTSLESLSPDRTLDIAKENNIIKEKDFELELFVTDEKNTNTVSELTPEIYTKLFNDSIDKDRFVLMDLTAAFAVLKSCSEDFGLKFSNGKIISTNGKYPAEQAINPVEILRASIVARGDSASINLDPKVEVIWDSLGQTGNPKESIFNGYLKELNELYSSDNTVSKPEGLSLNFETIDSTEKLLQVKKLYEWASQKHPEIFFRGKDVANRVNQGISSFIDIFILEEVLDKKEKELNSKSLSFNFFVKDTAEFEQYADFEPITNLSAKDAVKTLIEQENKGFSAGIGINIPGDFVFDDPEGYGSIVFHEFNEQYSFYMGDNFVKELKENNEHSQNVIAAFKELDKAIKESELVNKTSYVEPAFLYEKENELFGEKEMKEKNLNNSVEVQKVISFENIKLNNITKDENGFYTSDIFVPNAAYIKETGISDERFAMLVATWKDNDPNINLHIVKRLNSDPQNKEIEYLDVSSNGNPSLLESENWNLAREQKTFDIISEQIKQYKQELNIEKTDTVTEVKITPVTLEEILGVMDMRPDYTQNGNFMIFDIQRQEYISSWVGWDDDNGSAVFKNAAEAFERLDIYINDYYIHDMQEQLEGVGVKITGNETLSDLCKLYKVELENGNDKLYAGELNLAMGIVEPDTVIYEHLHSVEKNISLDNFDHKIFFDIYHSSYDEYYNTNSKELLKEQSENMLKFDELMKSNLEFKEAVSSLVAERKDPFSSDRECASVVKAFKTMGIVLEKTITQDENNEIRPMFILYGDTPDEKISELKEHLSMNGYDIKWKDKTEDNNFTEFTCNIDEKAYIQTILEDRGIDYEYELGLLAIGFDAAWLDEDEQLDAEVVTKEEFKRINELREKVFNDSKLPYIKIDYTEGSTSNHKSARMESGTVLGLREGEELLKELNTRFNTFLKCDVIVNFPDAKENEPGSYSLRYDFHDDKRTLDNGKEIPFEREGLSDYIRMTCSYPEVLEKYEEQWQKVNTPDITDEQKKLVEDIIAPNYEKLKDSYKRHCETLKSILENDKKVNSGWIVAASSVNASKEAVEKEQKAIATSFERYAGRCISHIADYLHESKNISFKDEFINYAEHQLSNMLQDVKYGDSRNAKYGEHGYDFDFGLWRKSLEKVMDAPDYINYFTERLQIEEKSYKEIRDAAKDMGLSKEENSAEETRMQIPEIGKEFSLSLKALYEHLSEKQGIFFFNDRSCVSLSNGNTIEFDDNQVDSEYTHYDELTYYDLYSKEGILLCCDGETVKFEGASQSGNFILRNENQENSFTLTPEEFSIATFSLNQQINKSIETDIENGIEQTYDFSKLAETIVQYAYETSASGFNNSLTYAAVADLAEKEEDWVKENISSICSALSEQNDNFLLDFNQSDALHIENCIDLHFCSVGEDYNELFKKGEDGRWIRKTDDELRQESLLDDVIDKGIESIQVNGGLSDAAIEAEIEAQIKEQEMNVDDGPEETVPVWTINGETFFENDIEESLKAEVEELFRQYDSGEREENLNLVGVKMYRDPSKDGKISLLVEFDSKNPENRWREDSLFNALNEEGIEFNGMKIDFNPITREKSGTIEQYLKKLEKFENEETVIKADSQKLEEKKIEQKLNYVSNKLSEIDSEQERILPFSIIDNKEKGRVNIKFETAKINREILKELKSHGWKYAASTKQWYPVGNAVNTASDFANRLQEKYTEIRNTNMDKAMDLGPEKSPYDGIRFFDRNYNDSEDFANFFNSKLHLFKNNKLTSITEEEATTILKAIGYEKDGIAENRKVRVGLDNKDNIVILTSEKGNINIDKIEITDILDFAKKKSAENVIESKQMLQNYLGKEPVVKNDLQDIFTSLYETCVTQAEEIDTKINLLYDSFIGKKQEQNKSVVLYQRNSYRGWEISTDKDFKKSVYVRPFEQTDRSGYILMAGKEGKDGFWQEKFVREMLKSNNWTERAALVETLTTLASDVETCESLGIKNPQSLNGFIASVDKIIHVENDTDIKNELMEKLLGPSEAQKVSKEKIKELSIGDKLGKDSVSDLYKISDGIYQATLSRNENGIGSAQNYFVIDNSIIAQLNDELKELVVSFDSKSVIENKRYEPYILKDLIEKGFMPPRDSEFVQKLNEHVSLNPLKYEKLKPVDYLNFEEKLKEIAEIDKSFNKTPFELGQQLLALVDENDKAKLNNWLLYEMGCDSKEHMSKLFASWLIKSPEQKKDISQKKNNGYPPRGEQ